MHLDRDSFHCSVCGISPAKKHQIKKGSIEAEWNMVELCHTHIIEMDAVGVLTFLKKYPLVDKLLLNKGWIRLLGKLWHQNSIKEHDDEKDSKKSSKEIGKKTS